MAKPKFDPNVLIKNTQSRRLDPTDFMRPMSEDQATTETPQPVTTSLEAGRVSQPTSTPRKSKPDSLPMPPAKRTEARVTVIFRASGDLDQRLKSFCQTHDASIQDTVTLAVEEFLDRRGS